MDKVPQDAFWWHHGHGNSGFWDTVPQGHTSLVYPGTIYAFNAYPK